MEPKFKRYRYQDGRLYDVILYDGYNKDDIVNFLDERFIKHTCTESYIDQSNGDHKTHIDIKIDINDDNIVDVYLSPYSYLLYDIGKKYIDKCEPETLCKNFKEVSIDDDKDTINESPKDDKINSYITILGTPYKLQRLPNSDPKFYKFVYGRCDSYTKEISIRDMYDEYKDETWHLIEWFIKNEEEILHHEIVHAYLNEAGLIGKKSKDSGTWSGNEDMVEWVAQMIYRISDTFREADAWLKDQYNILTNISPDNK